MIWYILEYGITSQAPDFLEEHTSVNDITA